MVIVSYAIGTIDGFQPPHTLVGWNDPEFTKLGSQDAGFPLIFIIIIFPEGG
jgi:hypothetical protein